MYDIFLEQRAERDLKALSVEVFHRIIAATGPGGEPETLGMPKDLRIQE